MNSLICSSIAIDCHRIHPGIHTTLIKLLISLLAS
jgi:hypothetical protein